MGVHRIEYRDVHNGQRATCAAWPKLLTEPSPFAGRRLCVVKPAGVDRDLIPSPNHVEVGLGFGFFATATVSGSCPADFQKRRPAIPNG